MTLSAVLRFFDASSKRQPLRLLAVAALGSLLAPGNAECYLEASDPIPDPFTLAGSMQALVVARCDRVPRGDQPAVFVTLRVIEGQMPGRFTASSPSAVLRLTADHKRYLLFILRSDEQESRFLGKAGYEVVPYIALPLPGITNRPLTAEDESQRIARAREVWVLAGAPEDQRKKILQRLPRGYLFRAVRADPRLFDDKMLTELLSQMEFVYDTHVEAYTRNIPPSAVTSSLLDRLSMSPRVGHRIAACVLASASDDPAFRSYLIRATRDTAAKVRLAAAKYLRPGKGPEERDALIRIATSSTADRLEKTWAQRNLSSDTSAAARALRSDQHPPETWTQENLLTALEDRSPDSRRRAWAEAARRKDREALRRMGERALQLRDSTERQSVNELGTIVMYLARSRDPSVFPVFVALVEDESQRANVINALRVHGDPRGLAIVRRYAEEDCRSLGREVSVVSTAALGELGDRSDLKTLVRWGRRCPDVPLLAGYSIGVIGNDDDLASFLKSLPDESHFERWQALDIREKARIRREAKARGVTPSLSPFPGRGHPMD